MGGILRVAGLVWAETMMEGVFFIMQTYLTDVWKLSFTNAATILNIWGGLYRILPFFFLFLADNLLGNIASLAFSGISSTAGIVLITVATMPVFGDIVSGGKCQGKEKSECVGQKEKVLFIVGMTLIALGRAARFACTEPFIDDQNQANEKKERRPPIWWVVICVLVFLFTPVSVIIAFPYIKKWYILFGVSTCCTTFATLFYLIGVHTYKKPKQAVTGSPVTNFVSVFVDAVFNIFRPSPKVDNPRLHQSLSSTRILGFLHKAAITLPEEEGSGEGEVKKRPSEICSVSEVESTKTLIRMFRILSSFIMYGVVASIGNTYFIEQASHMNSKIGKWEPPLQLLLLFYTLIKYPINSKLAQTKLAMGKFGDIQFGVSAAFLSVVCCAVAAAVERRRVHVLRRHNLLDLPDDGEVPMSAFWLYFQIAFLAGMESMYEYSLSLFLTNGAPRSMKRYQDCLVEGVTGLGYICGALSVYVVGKVSEARGGKNWFQPTLNQSRLDRYYWVLTVLCSLNLRAYLVALCFYDCKHPENVEEDEERKQELTLELLCIKKGTAIDLVMRNYCG